MSGIVFKYSLDFGGLGNDGQVRKCSYFLLFILTYQLPQILEIKSRHLFSNYIILCVITNFVISYTVVVIDVNGYDGKFTEL